MENRAGERSKAGSFAWLESKEAEEPSGGARECGKPHTHCWKTTLKRKEERKRGEQRLEF